jgi:hypothetical protein
MPVRTHAARVAGASLTFSQPGSFLSESRPLLQEMTCVPFLKLSLHPLVQVHIRVLPLQASYHSSAVTFSGGKVNTVFF